jgi:hypothetical protein
MATLIVYTDAHPETNTVDGVVVHYQSTTDWDTCHDATNGTSAISSNTDDLFAAARKDTSNRFGIYRGFFLFNTSTITSGMIINSATLSLYVRGKANSDNDGDDWVAIIPSVTPASNTNLTIADYDQCGATNNPTEAHDASERKDISAVGINAYLNWTLNAVGIAAINKTGISKFGAREGHDCIDSPYAGSANSSNYIDGNFAETAGTTQDPMLTVVYSAPSTNDVILSSPSGGAVVGGVSMY